MTIFASCKRVDCPDEKLFMSIAIANNTDYNINVTLYPKQEYIESDAFYKGSDYCGCFKTKKIIMEVDSTPMWSFDNILYYTKNFNLTPSELINQVFDSIYFELENSSNTIIKFLPDTSINYLYNPFENDTIWRYLLRNTDMPDNDCENKSDTKSYRFYLEKEYINN